MHPNRLATLRALCTEPPSSDVWEEICACVHLCDDEDELPVALSYAREHLKRWPDALRSVSLYDLNNHIAPSSTSSYTNGAWLADTLRGHTEPRFSLVRHASIHTPISKRQTQSLASSPNASQLRSITFQDANLSESALLQLLQASHLHNLRTLHIHRSQGAQTLSGQTATAIAESPILLQLHHLHLHGFRFSTTSLARLLYRTTPHNLHNLSLNHCLWNNSLTRVLCRVDWVRSLRSLSLRIPFQIPPRGVSRSVANVWTDTIQTARELGTIHWRNLEHLDLSGHTLRGQHFDQLLQHTSLPRTLHTLTLQGCDLQTLQPLRDHGPFLNLHTLDLRHNATLTPATFARFTALCRDSLPALRALHIPASIPTKHLVNVVTCFDLHPRLRAHVAQQLPRSAVREVLSLCALTPSTSTLEDARTTIADWCVRDV